MSRLQFAPEPSEKPTHSLSVSVSVHQKDYAYVCGLFTRVFRDLGATHPSASMTSVALDIEDDGPEDSEDLYYDEETLFKARRAMSKVLFSRTHLSFDALVTDLINELLNAGIVLRERR